MNVIRPITVGDGGSFTRASTKQCIGADGLLQTVPVDIPAFQYDPLNLSAAPVALLELAATNVLFFSSDFGNSTWFKSAATVSVNTVTAPDGTLTADAITFSGSGWVGQDFGTPVGTYTYSVFVKTNSRMILIGGGGAVSEISFSIQDFGGGLYRQAVSFTITSGALQPLNVPPAGATFPYVLSAWGAQLETGLVATSPIATAGASASRAADIITGTGLIWSNAPETAPAAYAGGTTYAKFATASVAGAGGLITVYQSQKAANLGNTPATSPLWWTALGTTYQVYSGTATYAINDIVIDPITHQTYQSIWPTANTGIALTDGTHWYNGEPTSRWATNRWAAFDDVVGSAVTLTGQVLMLIVPGAIDCAGLLNVGANSATIAMTDQASMTSVFKKSIDLTNDTSITDYDAYFFDDVTTVSDLYIDGFPPYYSAVMSIALTGLGQVSLGVAKFGKSFDLGGAQYGLHVGFISYTKKITDTDGSTSVQKGAISKRMTVTTMIDNANLDRTQQVMGELDGVPTVLVGVGNLYTSLIQFCFVKEFDTEIAYPTNSLCSFQTEGLI
jgi:hypothetical protein